MAISENITAFIFDKKIGGEVVLLCKYHTSGGKIASGKFHIRGDILRALYYVQRSVDGFPPRLLVENPGTENGYLLRNIVSARGSEVHDFYIIQNIHNDSHRDLYQWYGCHPVFTRKEWVKLQTYLDESKVEFDMNLINVSTKTADIFLRGPPKLFREHGLSAPDP